ncbi:small ribosomal subunit protein bS6m-like [Tubulanus polymorphus]|uniref:small ribosomal subunit protein bS6m-like n=1 Tax=Tubulanus polymorphus TaxID=672921 RepID=UPI003DA2744E
MPVYELSLIVRCLERPQLHQVLRRTAEHIMKRGGIVQSWEKYAKTNLPYKMRKNDVAYLQGNYFFVKFSSPITELVDLNEELGRDVDIIRRHIVAPDEPFDRPCKYGPCVWGEIPNPNYEKMIGKLRSFRKY